jgi:hypothetical protein
LINDGGIRSKPFSVSSGTDLNIGFFGMNGIYPISHFCPIYNYIYLATAIRAGLLTSQERHLLDCPLRAAAPPTGRQERYKARIE